MALKLSTAAVVVCIGGFLFRAGPAFSHHSYAGFDTKTLIKLEGEVTGEEWVNPHTWIHIVVEAYPSKDRLLTVAGEEITLPDGQMVFVGSTSTDGAKIQP